MIPVTATFGSASTFEPIVQFDPGYSPCLPEYCLVIHGQHSLCKTLLLPQGLFGISHTGHSPGFSLRSNACDKKKEKI